MAKTLAVALIVAAAPLSAALTWAAIRYATRRNLLDLPGERRSHHVATPRGGGVAIVLVSLVGLLVYGMFHPAARTQLSVFALGLFAVAAVGWWDDHRALSARLRLVVHLFSAMLLGWLVWNGGGGVGWALLTVLVAVSLVNVWNFMDGINGLAASQALIVSVAYGLLLGGSGWLAWVLASACLGFLPFNFPRARIFLGDVGSGAVGYLVAGLLVMTVSEFNGVPVVLLLPLIAFVGDAGLTLARRMLAGERWTQPHAQHLYQRLVKQGMGHTPVTIAYAVFTMLVCVLLHHLVALPWPVGLSVFLLCATAMGGLWFFLAREER